MGGRGVGVDDSDINFGGSVYRSRRRRSPLARLGKLVFYLSSLAPAAWIVWHYDLVNRMDRRLKGEEEAAPADPLPAVVPTAKVAPDAPQPERAPAVQSVAPGAEQASAGAAPPEPVVVSVAPNTPADAADMQAPQAPPQQAMALVIDLDLGGRKQRAALDGAAGKKYRIAKVTGCPASYSLDPANGALGERAPASVVIAGAREVVLSVSLDAGPRGLAVVVEPKMRTDEGKEIPFLMAGVEKARKRLAKQAVDAGDRLAALQAEQQRLVAWIGAPIVKPLAEVGQAKARVAALEGAIRDQRALAESLDAELEVATAVEKLARQLDAQCKLGIGVVD
jgi:hypothetical protein